MNEPIDFGRCLSFINLQLRPNASAVIAAYSKARWRAITISRQSGTGGHLVAEEVSHFLHLHGPYGAASWVIFDRNLLEKVLEDHHLSPHLAKYMPEDRISGIKDTLDELFGLHPPTWTLVEKTSDTILRLAELGNVILLGRGGNIITSKLDYMLHVRLIGARDERIEFVQADRKLDKKSASQIVDQEYEGRRRYVKRYFHKDIDDPQLYHLVINTPEVGHAAAARLIALTILSTYDVTHGMPATHG